MVWRAFWAFVGEAVVLAGSSVEWCGTHRGVAGSSDGGWEVGVTRAPVPMVLYTEDGEEFARVCGDTTRTFDASGVPPLLAAGQ